MNLQETLREAIKDKIVTGYENNSTDISSAAKSCVEIAERNAIEFASFTTNFQFSNHHGLWKRTITGETYTVSELYSLFLNSKDNG